MSGTSKYDVPFKHPSILLERKLLFHISQGNYKTSKSIMDEINEAPRKHLADDELESLKISVIISIALFTRGVINAGINYEQAFEDTDEVIRHITRMEDMTLIRKLEYQTLRTFCNKVKRHLMYSDSSFHISRAKIYIDNNLREVITPATVSDAIDLNQTYLSKIFKSEVGMTMGEYILEEKIKIAKELMAFSSYSLLEISNILHFTDQSHFTKKFKKVTGMTPKAFKETIPKSNLQKN